MKTSDSDEDIEIDEEQVAFITKNFTKFFKKKSFDKKGTGSKRQSNDNQTRFYKYGKTGHQTRDCPLWIVEWRNKRAEKELKEKAKKK